MINVSFSEEELSLLKDMLLKSINASSIQLNRIKSGSAACSEERKNFISNVQRALEKKRNLQRKLRYTQLEQSPEKAEYKSGECSSMNVQEFSDQHKTRVLRL